VNQSKIYQSLTPPEKTVLEGFRDVLNIRDEVFFIRTGNALLIQFRRNNTLYMVSVLNDRLRSFERYRITQSGTWIKKGFVEF